MVLPSIFPPATPKKKAGPVLLQNSSREFASCAVSFLSLYRFDTVFAPKGYPPIRLNTNGIKPSLDT